MDKESDTNSGDNVNCDNNSFNSFGKVTTDLVTGIGAFFNQTAGVVANLVGYGSFDNDNNNTSDCTDNSYRSYPGAEMTAAVATSIAAYFTQATGAVASLVGFGSPGIQLGSWAASMMSTAATSGWGAGLVSSMQSAGALFVNAAGSNVLVATGAIVVPAVVGYVAYQGYNDYYNRNSNKNELLNE